VEKTKDHTEALLERDAELARLERILDAVSAGEGSVTVIAAPAGLGKTRLLAAAIDAARPVGVDPLVARASVLEGEFAFGVVRQLFEPGLLAGSDEDRGELLSGAARHAAAALDLDPEADLARDALTTIHGLYWLAANLSARGPLLLAVDDLQWADEPSLVWLAYLARRLASLPIGVIATVRTDGAGAPEMPESSSEQGRAAVDQILGGDSVARLSPEGLTLEAVGAMIARDLGTTPDGPFIETCRERTRGNPFLLSELLAEVASEEIPPTESGIPELNRVVPRRVGETLRRHLARLSAPARQLADAIAVLGDGEELPAVAEFAGLPQDEAAGAAAELIHAQVLDDASELRFRHPLLRTAVEGEIPAPERGSRHGRAARLLAERRAGDQRVAAHLLLSPGGDGDPWAVEKLRAAARSARAQGAPAQATALLERALAEPPPTADRGAVLSELAWTELSSMQPTAGDRLAAARELSGDPKERAELAIGVGIALYYVGRHAEAVDLLIAAIDEASSSADLHEARLNLEAVLSMAGRYDLRTEERVRGRISELAETLDGASPAERLVQAIAAGQNPGPSADDLAHSTGLEERALGALPLRDPAEGMGTVAMYLHAGRPGAARSLVDRLITRARDEGSPLRYAMAVGARGVVEFDVGDLAAAESDLVEAVDAIDELGAAPLARAHSAFLVLVLAELGRPEDAERLLERYELAGELPERMLLNPTLFARGTLRAAQRRFDDAVSDFRELGRRQEAWGIKRPSPPWRSACAVALVGAGDADSARALAAEELEIARVWDTPKAIAVATRAVALAGEGEGSVELLGESVTLLEDTPWRLDLARARVDLGAAQRREGMRRLGRESLARAMDEAHACGAVPLAERAAEELRASGARPRRRAVSGLDALTPSERRVAELAAVGRTNREIAQELFVTMATVETHLTRVYRKLDLAGRAELAGALAGDPGPAAS
jgi:DNA-binding CsgD family transcriptional regulator/tetratricopeptide (TPR) repeat protein